MKESFSQPSSSEACHSDLHEQIDVLYEHIAETKDHEKNAQFTAAQSALQRELLALYPPRADGSSELKGIPAWEKLIGGSETETSASSAVVADVTDRVAALITKLRAEWGLDEI